ncbi:MAG TPA: phosphoribosyl-AMP cyclohydrolase [Firmicutes bacterium]|nr:phosphoribosyl-AMP cyclohydrolase [Bacillota bacterium]
MSLFDELKKDPQGLVPAIVQDNQTGEVLMMAYMNEEALEKTIATGKTHFYSRSRNKLWLKGESSGHIQEVKQILVDCDSDTLLLRVKQQGGACHTGYYSCFYRRLEPDGKTWKVIGKKVFDPEKVY